MVKGVHRHPFGFSSPSLSPSPLSFALSLLLCLLAPISRFVPALPPARNPCSFPPRSRPHPNPLPSSHPFATPFSAFPLCHAPFQPFPSLRHASLHRCRAFTILIQGFNAGFLPLVDVGLELWEAKNVQAVEASCISPAQNHACSYIPFFSGNRLPLLSPLLCHPRRPTAKNLHRKGICATKLFGHLYDFDGANERGAFRDGIIATIRTERGSRRAGHKGGRRPSRIDDAGRTKTGSINRRPSPPRSVAFSRTCASWKPPATRPTSRARTFVRAHQRFRATRPTRKPGAPCWRREDKRPEAGIACEAGRSGAVPAPGKPRRRTTHSRRRGDGPPTWQKREKDPNPQAQLHCAWHQRMVGSPA